jgi:AbrB family looped-hinge helix DNA binding protein
MEAIMTTVKVSPKYQIVIPKEVRDKMGLKPGDLIEVFQFNGRIEFIPSRNARELKGFIKGLDASLEREDDRT